MTATVSYRDALAVLGEAERKRFVSSDRRWTLVIEGLPVPCGTDWNVMSPYGELASAVVVLSDGVMFDRPVNRYAPSVHVVAWGRDANGAILVAVIRQPRPHADDPEHEGDGHAPLVFGQTVMGFKDGLSEGRLGALKDAIREAMEETGATAIINVEQPPYPYHNSNPADTATWSDVVFVEVNLEKVERLKHDRTEPIYTAEYIPFKELLRRIREGRDAEGAIYRSGTSNSLWLMFLACHEELIPEFLSELRAEE